jgi:hypothetical protein
MDEHDVTTPTLGLRCAWCGIILREPVGFPNNALAWTHGMCPDCQKRFEDDALLTAPDGTFRDTHDIRRRRDE